jgi:branched-chain amino acid transport system permease protein
MDYVFTLLATTGINMILALSMYAVMSTGQLSLAQGAMFGIGAYVAAWSTTVAGLPLALALAAGAVTAALIGALLGAVLLRLAHFYFAIATLAFGELVRVFLLNFKWVTDTPRGPLGPQGELGFQKIYYLADHGVTSAQFAGLIWGILAALFALFALLDLSRMGSAAKIVRDDELVAATMGLDPTWIKITAFSLGSGVAALGGGLYAHFTTYLLPGYFGFARSFEALIFVAVGGMDTFLGAVAGAAFLTLVPETTRVMQDYRMIFFGLLLIVVVLFRPRGIVDRRLLRGLRWRKPRTRHAAGLARF